jgi:hypothetical protein
MVAGMKTTIETLLTPLPRNRAEALRQAVALRDANLQWHLDDDPASIITVPSFRPAFVREDWQLMRDWVQAADDIFRPEATEVAHNAGAWHCVSLAGWFGEGEV